MRTYDLGQSGEIQAVGFERSGDVGRSHRAREDRIRLERAPVECHLGARTGKGIQGLEEHTRRSRPRRHPFYGNAEEGGERVAKGGSTGVGITVDVRGSLGDRGDDRGEGTERVLVRRELGGVGQPVFGHRRFGRLPRLVDG